MARHWSIVVVCLLIICVQLVILLSTLEKWEYLSENCKTNSEGHYLCQHIREPEFLEGLVSSRNSEGLYEVRVSEDKLWCCLFSVYINVVGYLIMLSLNCRIYRDIQSYKAYCSAPQCNYV